MTPSNSPIRVGFGVVLALVGACGDGDAPGADAALTDAMVVDGGSCAAGCEACREWVTRAADCATGVTPEERAAAFAECVTDAGFGARTSGWSSGFAAAFTTCVEAISCADAENIDDICIPQGLSAVNGGQLSTALLGECASGSTDACRTMILADGAGDAGVVSDCLEKWAGCDGMFGDNFWTEDNCLSLLTLEPVARSAAEPCISMECPAVGECLRTAGAFGW